MNRSVELVTKKTTTRKALKVKDHSIVSFFICMWPADNFVQNESYYKKCSECPSVKLPLFQVFNLLLALWAINKYLTDPIGSTNDPLHARDHLPAL